MGLEKQSNETVQLQADTVKSHPSLTIRAYHFMGSSSKLGRPWHRIGQKGQYLAKNGGIFALLAQNGQNSTKTDFRGPK